MKIPGYNYSLTETGTELIKDTKEKSQAPTPPPTPTVTPEREGETPGVAGDSRLMGSPTFKEQHLNKNK